MDSKIDAEFLGATDVAVRLAAKTGISIEAAATIVGTVHIAAAIRLAAGIVDDERVHSRAEK